MISTMTTAATAQRPNQNANFYCTSYYDSDSSILFNSSPSPNKKRTPLSPINSAQGSAVLTQVHNNGNVAKSSSSVSKTLMKKTSSSVIDSLKENVKINPECYLYSTFLPNLVIEKIGTPMLAHTPVVSDPMTQLTLYKNQVAVCRGARDKTCTLFTNLTAELFFYHCAPKCAPNAPKGIQNGPSDHSFDRTTCALHTDSLYLKRPDIRPSVGFLVIFLERYKKITMFFGYLSLERERYLFMGKFGNHLLQVKCLLFAHNNLRTDQFDTPN
jgi:hypothetical protein